jgi:Transposase zinc-binding domain
MAPPLHHCQYTHIRYRSCRNRHCPKCQGAAREKWLQQRTAELLPTEYFHVVFTLPEPIAAIVFYHKEVVYDLLFGATAETASFPAVACRLTTSDGFRAGADCFCRSRSSATCSGDCCWTL